MSEHQQERQRVESIRESLELADRVLKVGGIGTLAKLDLTFLLNRHDELVKLLEEARQALLTVKPWCLHTHGHKTCDIERVSATLTAINNKIGESK